MCENFETDKERTPNELKIAKHIAALTEAS
jgi:hypothetical protein